MSDVRRNVKRGFTIVELMLVVTLFAIGSIAISATYINFTRLHRRAANAEILGEEARFAMELMVRAARNNPVNFYQSATYPTTLPRRWTRLSLGEYPGGRIYVQRLAGTHSACIGLEVDYCLGLLIDGVATWTPITGKHVNVTSFVVVYTPYESPFISTGVGTYDNDQQPRVTITMELEYLANNPREQADLSIQTSVGSRVYVR